MTDCPTVFPPPSARTVHPTLEITTTLDPALGSVLRVCGDVDLATAHTLVAAALAEPVLDEAPLRLDLSEVRFIDSSGVSALLEVRRASEQIGHRVEVVASSAAVDRVLALVGITDLFASS